MTQSSYGSGQSQDSNAGQSGEKVIPADQLETVPSRTSVGQKVLIALGVIFLIVIGFSFQGAQEREDRAAQELFSQPIDRIVRDIGVQTGLAHQFGLPAWQLKAGTQNAVLELDFPKGALSQAQASTFGSGVCAALARTYVQKGYMPTHIRVIVSAGGKPCGAAVFNGNIDALGWEPAR